MFIKSSVPHPVFLQVTVHELCYCSLYHHSPAPPASLLDIVISQAQSSLSSISLHKHPSSQNAWAYLSQGILSYTRHYLISHWEHIPHQHPTWSLDTPHSVSALWARSWPFLFSFWRNWSSERASNLLVVTQLKRTATIIAIIKDLSYAETVLSNLYTFLRQFTYIS